MTYTNFYQLNTLSANNYTEMLWNLSQSDSILLQELQKHCQHNTTSTVHLVHTATSSSVIKQQVLPEWITSLFTVNINMKIPFFWDKALCNCVMGTRRFERNLTPSVSRIVVPKTNRHIGPWRWENYATSKRRNLRQSGAASYPKRESSNYTAAKTSKLTS
jgi:hypothetical protein